MSREFAGALRQLIRIERRGEGRSPDGAASGGWTLVRSAWAEMQPARWGPPFEGGAVSARTRWMTRLRSGGAPVQLGDRIVWKGLKLEVRAIEATPASPQQIILQSEELP